MYFSVHAGDDMLHSILQRGLLLYQRWHASEMYKAVSVQPAAGCYSPFTAFGRMIHFCPLSLHSSSISSSSSSSSSPSHLIPQTIMTPPHPPPLPVGLLKRAHWPWLIYCIWLNERSFTQPITIATAMHDRWPLTMGEPGRISRYFIEYFSSTSVQYLAVCCYFK